MKTDNWSSEVKYIDKPSIKSFSALSVYFRAWTVSSSFFKLVQILWLNLTSFGFNIIILVTGYDRNKSWQEEGFQFSFIGQIRYT